MELNKVQVVGVMLDMMNKQVLTRTDEKSRKAVEIMITTEPKNYPDWLMEMIDPYLPKRL